MPNLRSSVHRKSRSIGSLRNFSSSSLPDDEESLARVRSLFCYPARYYYSDGLLKDLRERELYLKQREKFWTDIAKS